jgi:hypothetical protein
MAGGCGLSVRPNPPGSDNRRQAAMQAGAQAAIVEGVERADLVDVAAC